MTDAERLIEEHYVEVYRLGLRLLGDPDAAVELTQEVFYRAIRALPRFRGESTPRTWLYRITLNESRRPRREPASASTAAFAERPAPDPGPDEVTLARLDAARLHQLIRALPDPYRQVVVLHYLQNLDLREVATLLGAPENTVKTWLHRARARLREAWGES
jgi:RNA polymerase sigma-70 factor (ECF subfamily)